MDRIEKIADAATKLMEGVSNITGRMDKRRGDAKKTSNLPSQTLGDAYRGYFIIKSPFTSEVYIKKDNTNIATAKSVAEAKKIIDTLV